MPSVDFSRRTVAGVPLLLARPDDGGGRAPLPLVLWCHGFRSSSEDHRTELARLAGAGFLAAGLDAVEHGERRAPDLDARVAAARGRVLGLVLDLVAATAKEIPAVVRGLANAGLAAPGPASLAGISMGGYLAYRAALEEPSLGTVVALLGDPEWPRPDSPHRRPEAFRRIALLSITAERDENVPPEGARRFHAALAEGHPAPERVRYLELPGAVHLMGPEHWAMAMDATVEWLVRHRQGAAAG